MDLLERANNLHEFEAAVGLGQVRVVNSERRIDFTSRKRVAAFKDF
jgi:hypothetical protein